MRFLLRIAAMYAGTLALAGLIGAALTGAEFIKVAYALYWAAGGLWLYDISRRVGDGARLTAAAMGVFCLLVGHSERREVVTREHWAVQPGHSAGVVSTRDVLVCARCMTEPQVES